MGRPSVLARRIHGLAHGVDQPDGLEAVTGAERIEVQRLLIELDLAIERDARDRMPLARQRLAPPTI